MVSSYTKTQVQVNHYFTKPLRQRVLAAPIRCFLASHQRCPLAPRQQWQHLCLRRIHREAVPGAQLLPLAMLDEAVGPADADYRNRAAQLRKRFNHRRAEAAHLHMVLRSEEHTSELQS